MSGTRLFPGPSRTKDPRRATSCPRRETLLRLAPLSRPLAHKISVTRPFLSASRNSSAPRASFPAPHAQNIRHAPLLVRFPKLFCASPLFPGPSRTKYPSRATSCPLPETLLESQRDGDPHANVSQSERLGKQPPNGVRRRRKNWEGTTVGALNERPLFLESTDYGRS